VITTIIALRRQKPSFMEDPSKMTEEDIARQSATDYIHEQSWHYAKSMPLWPHEYTLLDRSTDRAMFYELVKTIRKYGYQKMFFKKEMTYMNIGEYKYWSMGAPVEETILINRCFHTRTNFACEGLTFGGKPADGNTAKPSATADPKPAAPATK